MCNCDRLLKVNSARATFMLFLDDITNKNGILPIRNNMLKGRKHLRKTFIIKNN